MNGSVSLKRSVTCPWHAGRDTWITVADMTYRLDACPRRRKDFVKMGNDSRHFFQGEVKGSKRYGPCLIAIGYTTATTDDLRGTMDDPFIRHRRRRTSRRRRDLPT